MGSRSAPTGTPPIRHFSPSNQPVASAFREGSRFGAYLHPGIYSATNKGLTVRVDGEKAVSVSLTRNEKVEEGALQSNGLCYEGLLAQKGATAGALSRSLLVTPSNTDGVDLLALLVGWASAKRARRTDHACERGRRTAEDRSKLTRWVRPAAISRRLSEGAAGLRQELTLAEC